MVTVDVIAFIILFTTNIKHAIQVGITGGVAGTNTQKGSSPLLKLRVRICMHSHCPLGYK